MTGQPRTWAVIAGGGTGGHLYPGIAVAEALIERGHDPATLRFVGARRGLEAKARALDGFPVTLLPGRGLVRRVSLRSFVANSEAVADLCAAVAMAVFSFSRWRPAVVISLGGYASFACVVAASLWRVPIVVVNVDAVPGVANRLATRAAAASAVSSPEVHLPRSVVTGVPVRAGLAHIDRRPVARAAARERLGLPPNAKVVAVSGGSLGSLRINRAALELAELWAARTDVAIRHVVGRRDWDEFHRELRPPGDLVYQQVEYEQDMVSLYSAADVAVLRAGANTVAELALAGVPAVLVPLPGSPGDHQGANARFLAGAGGAVVVRDDELDGARLAKELGTLLADPGRLATMEEAVKGLGRPKAADAVAQLAEEHARPRPGERSNRAEGDASGA
ncbi:MAG TPA: UDP-N-acetylglucosamine--N-acetylmuramyl-(pentapeptide) pyrophosphoryl-undecaprenol N-acetylglucosamine transferase [Acidimicrobiales bacterium]|nr:UDP-N-acetylglucosamine--N-acetylmuramyl-(pentapeptide) pyrophosphoryl-undecaprenol N-acetylglucosamine transferase [Acidimicrobiales bacterium]